MGEYLISSPEKSESMISTLTSSPAQVLFLHAWMRFLGFEGMYCLLRIRLCLNFRPRVSPGLQLVGGWKS